MCEIYDKANLFHDTYNFPIKTRKMSNMPVFCRTFSSVCLKCDFRWNVAANQRNQSCFGEENIKGGRQKTTIPWLSSEEEIPKSTVQRTRTLSMAYPVREHLLEYSFIMNFEAVQTMSIPFFGYFESINDPLLSGSETSVKNFFSDTTADESPPFFSDSHPCPNSSPSVRSCNEEVIDSHRRIRNEGNDRCYVLNWQSQIESLLENYPNLLSIVRNDIASDIVICNEFTRVHVRKFC